ncbi:MAG: hypothetical protein ACOYVK_13430 [Bacillota bacterium]
MIKNITLNLNAIEAMYFFWNTISSKDKVTEKFIVDIANMESFQVLYNEEFTQESVRRCLSALSNREPFHGNKTEAKFYSRNLMILEYIDTLEEKFLTFKSLRLQDILHSLHNQAHGVADENIEIIVVPAPFDTHYRDQNRIIINFFKFHVINGQLRADDMDFADIVANTYKEK